MTIRIYATDDIAKIRAQLKSLQTVLLSDRANLARTVTPAGKCQTVRRADFPEWKSWDSIA